MVVVVSFLFLSSREEEKEEEKEEVEASIASIFFRIGIRLSGVSPYRRWSVTTEMFSGTSMS